MDGAAESVSGHGGHICNVSPPPPSQLCVAPSSSSGPFSMRESAHLAAVLAQTWKHGQQHSVRSSGSRDLLLAGTAVWPSADTTPLLTPQLTSASAPLLEEQRGRHSPPFTFYLYFPLSFSAWVHPGPRKLPSYFTNAFGKISLSGKSVITQELYFYFLTFTLFHVHRGGWGLEILKTPGRVCSDLFTKSSTFPLL